MNKITLFRQCVMNVLVQINVRDYEHNTKCFNETVETKINQIKRSGLFSIDKYTQQGSVRLKYAHP